MAKPVLITVDDALNDQKAWDGLFQKYGMKGVMFVVTGFADNTTPGDSDSNNMTLDDHQPACCERALADLVPRRPSTATATRTPVGPRSR